MSYKVSIEELCERFNLTEREIHEYEDLGIIRVPGEMVNGSVMYDLSVSVDLIIADFFCVIGIPINKAAEIINLSSSDISEELEDKTVSLRSIIVDLMSKIMKIAEVIGALKTHNIHDHEVIEIILKEDDLMNDHSKSYDA